MNMYGIQDGRYYVALSLAEAESLRAAMHGAKRERMEGAGDGQLHSTECWEEWGFCVSQFGLDPEFSGYNIVTERPGDRE